MSEHQSENVTDSAKLAVLRKLIGKRKRFDRIFFFTGAVLTLLALSVLAMLGLKLLVDGGSRLVETNYVNASGETPGFRDVVGTFTRTSPADEVVGYLVAPNPINLETDSKIDLAPFVGKRIAISGELSYGLVTASKITVVDSIPPGQPIPDKPTIVGKITAITDNSTDYHKAQFQPETMRVNVPSDNEVKPEAMVNKVVAVDTGRGGRGRKPDLSLIDARQVQPLVKQSFFTAYPSKNAEEAGIYPALIGTVLVMIVTSFLTIPLGVAAGVYLEEYARKNWFTSLIEINISNLAGVPSVIWGLLGLGMFVYLFNLGDSVLTAGLTLGLLVLPVIIIATRESIRAVPNTIREASIGLGATKWQTIRYHILPYSTGGILTGAIIGLSRAVGETAPLVLVGALTFLNFSPVESANPADWLGSQYSVLPIMTYEWVSRPQPEFHRNAAAGSIVLVTVTLMMNAFAIGLRYRLRRNLKW